MGAHLMHMFFRFFWRNLWTENAGKMVQEIPKLIDGFAAPPPHEHFQTVNSVMNRRVLLL